MVMLLLYINEAGRKKEKKGKGRGGKEEKRREQKKEKRRERVIEKVKIITGEERLKVVIILSRIVKAINYWNVFNVKK